MNDHAIRRTAVYSPMSSASKILSKQLAKSDFDLTSHKPFKITKLTQAVKSEAIGLHQETCLMDTSIVKTGFFFSDESTVQQFSTCKYYVRRHPRKHIDEHYTLQTIKNSQKCHNLRWNGIIALFFPLPKTTMDGTKYVDLLPS